MRGLLQSGAVGCLLAAGLQPTVANAQQTPQASDSPAFNDIVVTARRKEEKAQKVPISITTLSPQLIEDNNAKNLQDIQAFVPSMSVSTGNVGSKDTANVSIRGQGWNSLSGQPAVALYLDEVPIVTNVDGQLMGGPGFFFDLEGVDVLKGPQGTLFGKNTSGGAVLLRSAKPGNEFGGHVQLGYGNYNDREYDAAVSVPIIKDVLLTRWAVNGQVRDGYTHVLSTPDHPNGIDFDNRNTFSARGTISLIVSSDVKNDLYLNYQHYSSHGSGAFLTDVDSSSFGTQLQPYLAQQNALGARVHIPIDTATPNNSGGLKYFSDIFSAKLLPNITFRNIIGYQEAELNQSVDVDGSPLQLFDVPYVQDTQRLFSEEAQLQGNSIGGRLEWQAGVFHIHGSMPVLSQLHIFVPGAEIAQRRGSTTFSDAVYAQGSFKIVDNLKFTAGLRKTWDRKDTLGLGADPTDPTPSYCGVPLTNCSTLSVHTDRSSAVTYTLGLDYQVTDKTLVYLASRRGYRPGGDINVNIPKTIGSTDYTTEDHPYSSEYVTDYELGIKTDFTLGVPIRFDAAIYKQYYTNIQVNRLVFFPTIPGGANIVENAASAHLWGGEVELNAKLTKEITVGAFYSHLDFKYVNFLSGVDAAGITAGETANRVPNRFGATLNVKVPLDPSIGTLRFNSIYTWQDQSGDFLGTHVIPAYGVANASLDWDRFVGSPVDVSLFVTNIADRTYKTGGIGFGLGFVESTYGDPRMFGIRVKFHFGADK